MSKTIRLSYRILGKSLGLVLVCLFCVSCTSPFALSQPQTASLPGWRTPTDYLFVTLDDLPQNWQFNPTFPTAEPDPTINENARTWIQADGSISVYQIIWRSYTIEDAQKRYLKLYNDELRTPQAPIPSNRTYCEFTTPAEMTFRSKAADEFYVGCGWLDLSTCEVMARYRNYVTLLRMDAKSQCNNKSAEGLSYAEIEKIIQAMDSHFEKFLDENPIDSPGK